MGAMHSRHLLAGARLPSHEACRLLVVASGRTRSDVLAGFEVSLEVQEAFESMAEARRDGEPLQYLEGTASFGRLELVVDARVLIPRPETEHMAELAAAGFHGRGAFVDLCTGSGALALFLKDRHPSARVIGTDISADAIDVARLNGSRLGLEVGWREGDLFEALDKGLRGGVDLIVSNPPYVAEGEWSALAVDVRREPRLALVAGPTGLEVIERILSEVAEWLTPSGSAWIEVGDGQAGRLAGSYQVRDDLNGQPRYLVVGKC
jgi:release factor glutamine methyltransferase